MSNLDNSLNRMIIQAEKEHQRILKYGHPKEKVKATPPPKKAAPPKGRKNR